MPWDRAVQLWLTFALDGKKEVERMQIEALLEPPVTLRIGGVPAWYGSDDEAWAEFNS